jgi:hypothetical protein
MATISQQLIEKIASQEVMMASIQVQVAHIKNVSDENNRALRGYDNFQGLITSVSLISTGMEGLKDDVSSFAASMAEINASIRQLGATLDKDACRECNIDEVSEQLAALQRYNDSYPNILWLLRHKTKSTILVLIVSIVLISGLGHLGAEPTTSAALAWLGLPPATIAGILTFLGVSK